MSICQEKGIFNQLNFDLLSAFALCNQLEIHEALVPVFGTDKAIRQQVVDELPMPEDLTTYTLGYQPQEEVERNDKLLYN